MVAAFILDSLGAPRGDVIADFLRTNQSGRDEHTEREMAAFLQRFRTLSPKALAAMQGVRQEWLATLLARVAEQYGSVAQYLVSQQLDPQRFSVELLYVRRYWDRAMGFLPALPDRVIERSIDIDSPIDFQLVEIFMQQKLDHAAR